MVEYMLQESRIPTYAVDRFSLDDALQDVLIHNKEEFVLLFLESGANLNTFLNEDRLQKLYGKVNEAPCFIPFSFTFIIHVRINDVIIVIVIVMVVMSMTMTMITSLIRKCIINVKENGI